MLLLCRYHGHSMSGECLPAPLMCLSAHRLPAHNDAQFSTFRAICTIMCSILSPCLACADPGSTYRTRDEVSSARSQRDPIEHVRKLLIDETGVEKEELKKIEKVRLCRRWASVRLQRVHLMHLTLSCVLLCCPET